MSSLSSHFGKVSDNFSVDDNDIIYKYRYPPGKVDNFIGFFDLEDFYNKLIDLLTYNPIIRFYDVISLEKGDDDKGKFFKNTIAELGEHIEMGELRSGNNFEKRFMFKELSENFFEIEWEIKARAKLMYSPFSWLYVRIEMVNRGSRVKEVVENGVKKKLYGGKWEFRNEFVFKNSLIVDYLNKLPIVKNSDLLRIQYIEKVAGKSIYQDIKVVDEKLVPLVQGFIDKYFNRV